MFDGVRAVGIDFFTQLVDGDVTLPGGDAGAGIELLTDAMAVRTRFFDDFFVDACDAGVRQAVILASATRRMLGVRAVKEGAFYGQPHSEPVEQGETDTNASSFEALPPFGHTKRIRAADRYL